MGVLAGNDGISKSIGSSVLVAFPLSMSSRARSHIAINRSNPACNASITSSSIHMIILCSNEVLL
jgi:hypothetical protein